MSGLASLFTWPARYPLRAISIGVALAIISLLGIARLRPDTSLENLFARNDPAANALVRVMNNFSAVEELLLLVTARGTDPAPQPLLDFAQRLNSAVSASADAAQMSNGVIYRADAQTREFFEKVLVPNGLFYLSDDAFAAAKQRLTLPEMQAQFRQNQVMLSAPGPAAQALAKVLLKDPLHLRDFILDQLAASRPFKTYNNSDAFISADGRSLLIRIRGRRPITDMEFCREFTATISRLADGVNADHLQLEFAGSYAIAAAAERSIRHDMIVGIFTSVISLQLLFLIAYRRPFRSFALAFAPVAIGILYGFGAYAGISATLTPMSAVIGGVLAGMAIDYSIQYLAHYDARRDAASTSRALAPAMVAAWVTSVFGFMAIGSSQVKALRDFSLLGTLGLTGAFFGAVFLLPAILRLIDRRLSPQPLSRFSIDSLLHRISTRPRIVLTVSIGVILAMCLPLLHPADLFALESDLTVMHPRPNPPLEAQQHIAERMGTSPGSLIIHLQADGPEALLTLAHRVNERLHAPNVHDAGIENIYSLASLLPDPAAGPARVAQTGEAYAAAVLSDFRSAVAASDFAPAAYEPYGVFLHYLLTRPAAPGISDLLPYRSLAEPLLPKTMFAGSGMSTTASESLAYIFARSGDETRASRDAAIDAVRNAIADLPGATLTGLSVLSHDAELSVRHDLPRLILAALGAVAIYLLLHFRTIADSLLALLPTAVSMIILLAFMRIIGIKLNMINLVAFPLLIGIDVDYGIFLVTSARVRRARSASLREFIAEVAPSAQAVLLCAAATLLGFGSLIFTSIPAVRSLGLCVSVGVVACAAAVFFLVLPILFKLSDRR